MEGLEFTAKDFKFAFGYGMKEINEMLAKGIISISKKNKKVHNVQGKQKTTPAGAYPARRKHGYILFLYF